ncbi:unnamed protein product, partial [Iphiclides podalirius]
MAISEFRRDESLGKAGATDPVLVGYPTLAPVEEPHESFRLGGTAGCIAFPKRDPYAKAFIDLALNLKLTK